MQDYWLVPPPGWAPAPPDAVEAARALARAAAYIAEEKPAQALPFIRRTALAATPLAPYAVYLKGMAELGLERYEQARRTFESLRASPHPGYLTEAVALQLAEVNSTLGSHAAAAALYDEVLAGTPAAADDVLLRLARAASRAGDRARALTAYESLYYDWPASEAADAAAEELPAGEMAPLEAGSPRLARELARGERLFEERRYGPAREAFERLAGLASGDAAELVALRLAECDYFLRRYQRVREDLKPWLTSASRRDEARYFDLMAARAAGKRADFIALTRALVTDFPASAWAEDALNALASTYAAADEDENADAVYREIASRFPSGRYTARAQWKMGWRAYRQRRFAEAANVFEAAAVAFPRSDFRPSWLYWAAKARSRLDGRPGADDAFRLVVADYGSSYYGRLAAEALAARPSAPPAAGRAAPARAAGEALADGAAPPTASLIRWLVSVGMYYEALDEVRYAERTWGASPLLAATRAWLLNRTGVLRPAINLMRRTYPQFLTAGGDAMPREILEIIYPLDHWALLRRYAGLHKLDPYLVAALVAQESTFERDIVSPAKAIGLMQVLPTTGRQWAARLGIRGFSRQKLTVPEVNVRIGTAYLASLVARFGSEHLALAAYNAGESRVARWLRERPGLPQDEFIDDIPFPETQNYVRRILGTAVDYRKLYAAREPGSVPAASATRKPASLKKR
ncbi:MAG TPA: transglycosylase SLT domain-containing protein [Vicinamibacterales bacterium]|nr:transglycosylase SLT domain-containing protein [Vicinamibacterales bacterium]HOQ59564.1 transglycosylase SLT domain-containing protein [Vicinamibacterales bacterium]HPK71218.1 transglycosylase SLT domain-containing protein [Vicinamibacterales bacterium]